MDAENYPGGGRSFTLFNVKAHCCLMNHIPIETFRLNVSMGL